MDVYAVQQNIFRKLILKTFHLVCNLVEYQVLQYFID